MSWMRTSGFRGLARCIDGKRKEHTRLAGAYFFADYCWNSCEQLAATTIALDEYMLNQGPPGLEIAVRKVEIQ